MKKVVLIGDSIRLHYQPQVAQALISSADISGPAENCRSSADVRKNLQRWALELGPDIVHLNCGAHDLRYDPGTDTPLVPIDRYVENLEWIFTALAKPNSTIIWATTTPINQVRHQAHREARRYESDVAKYNAAALEIAHRHSAQINDLNGAVVEAGRDRVLKSDGIHFTERGYAFLAERVTAAIRLALEEAPTAK